MDSSTKPSSTLPHDEKPHFNIPQKYMQERTLVRKMGPKKDEEIIAEHAGWDPDKDDGPKQDDKTTEETQEHDEDSDEDPDDFNTAIDEEEPKDIEDISEAEAEKSSCKTLIVNLKRSSPKNFCR